MIQIPPSLKAGDKIGLVCTARLIEPEKLDPALQLFQEWKLKVMMGQTIILRHNQFAGTDAERIADFQRMLDNPEIKAIFCAKGGYGTVRILDGLDFTKFKKNPKWIIGFSDITALHSHLHRNYQIATLHAPMPSTYKSSTDVAMETLQTALANKNLHYKVNPHPFNRQGKVEAPLVGGNLSVLYSLLGSNSDISTDGKILFLEDLDEYLYHIDRMVVNLKRNGKLAKLAGLIVGGMTDMKDNDTPFGKNGDEIIAEHVASYDYPVCFGFPAGHWENNQALVLGANCSLNVKEGKVDFLQKL